jgi:hypothetical protein
MSIAVLVDVVAKSTMKTTLLILIIFCAAAAFGQSGISNQPVIVQFTEHPEHASVTPMATERPIVGGAPDNYSYAHGERPLWEFGPVSEPAPLGDVARAYRKEKTAAKKAGIVLEKQGS